MWLWLGDVIYADKATLELIRRPSPLPAMKSMYRQQYNHPAYSLVRQHSRVLGIYDDHDYGENDGNAEYVDKEAARHLFLDFIDEPVQSERRQRDGVYADYTWGPAGQRTKLILLDGRYNQLPDADDMLGEKQWKWLEQSINSDEVDLYIMGVGVQLVSTDKRIGEGWRLRPQSRARVLQLFAQRQRNPDAAVVFLSGDIHFAEADVTYWCSSDSASSNSPQHVTPFYEFTSSGMTHSVGSQITQPIADRVLPFILSPRDSYAESLSPGESIRGFWSGKNFGLFDVDWQQREVQISIVDPDDRVRLHYRLPFASLSRMTFPNAESVPAYLRARCEGERHRAVSPPMFVVPGVKFAVGVLVAAHIVLAVVIGAVWHWLEQRKQWKQKREAAREVFKLTLKEKQEQREKKKKEKASKGD